MMVLGLILFFAFTIIFISVAGSRRYAAHTPGRFLFSVVAPFQKATSGSVRFFQQIWRHYFFLISVSEQNRQLRRELAQARSLETRCREIELTNDRLRSLLDFKARTAHQVLAAEVIGKDPSPWFKSVIIDKGSADGLRKGLPVLIPEGIAGVVTELSPGYAKVLLIIDPNSAVDVLVQRTRARGMVKGKAGNRCELRYVLRKHALKVGDAVVSSGLDGIFPKGLRVGRISDVVRHNTGIFQEVTVTPYVDFETLEEVLVILDPPPSPEFVRPP